MLAERLPAAFRGYPTVYELTADPAAGPGTGAVDQFVDSTGAPRRVESMRA